MAFNYKKRSSKRCRFCGAMYVSVWDTRDTNIHFQTHRLDREDSSLQLTVSSKCDHSPFQSLQSYHILAQVHVTIQSNMTVCICEKVQFWLLAKLLNVQETTSHCISKVKWSPGCFSSVIHSYLFIPKKNMLHQQAWFTDECICLSYILHCVCVCVCISDSVHARGTPGRLLSVTKIAERLICYMGSKVTAEWPAWNTVSMCG